MKFKFKYVSMLVMAAMMAGFTACSDKDPIVEGGDNSDLTELSDAEFSIQVEIPEAKGTRTESYTNVGIKPHVFDMTLVFVGKTQAGQPDKVLRVFNGNVSALTGTGQKFKELPAGVNGLYVIGNTEDTYAGSSHQSTVSDYNAKAQMDFGKLAYHHATRKTLLDYDNSGIPVDEFMKEVKISLDNYELTDAKAVNISGYAPITSTQGIVPVRVVVTPAISRYEIAKIESTTTNFKLLGVYINNTMRQISVDGQQYPDPELSAEAELVKNYGWNAPQWNYSLWGFNFDKLKADKKLEFTYYGGTADEQIRKIEFDPTYDFNVWSTAYYNYTTAYLGPDAYPARATDLDYLKNAELNYTYGATWDKWYENFEAETSQTAKTFLKSHTPMGTNKYWSYYIASARKQDPNDKGAITNPYLDEGSYNRIGFECGKWPYQSELDYIAEGEGTRTSYKLNKNGVAFNAEYNYPGLIATPLPIQTMDVSDPLFVGSGKKIQYGMFPTICIEVELETPNVYGMTRGWLTVTKFLDADNNNFPLQYPKPGTVYVIKAITFDPDKNLTPDPMWPKDETEIGVQVIVQGWVGQNTNVEID